jgi:Glycosyltransferase family 87
VTASRRVSCGAWMARTRSVAERWTVSLTFVLMWGVAAAISLAVGTANALRNGQSQDVKLVREWSALWLWNSANPYAVDGADYPPNALTWFGPLALLPEHAVALLWVGLSVALAPVAVWLGFRLLFPHASPYAALLPGLLFLCWGGLRVGLGVGQFHVLTLVLGLAAVATADKRPGLAGILLGLALVKPHFAGAFLLWAILTRRFRVVAVALLVVLLSVLAFCVRVGQSPVEITASYLQVLKVELAGSTPATGIDLRPVVQLWLGTTIAASVAHVGLLAALFTSVLVVAARLGRSRLERPDMLMLSVCCAFAVLGVPHSTYDVVLLLPVMLWLYEPWVAPQPDEHSNSRRTMFWLLQATLVLEIPGLAYKLTPAEAAPPSLLSGVDAVVVALVFVYLVWRVLVASVPPRARREEPGLEVCARTEAA